MDAMYEVAAYEFRHKTGTENEEFSRFRTVLEPYVYHHLISHHMARLNETWETYHPPYESENAFVIVERRPHPNFEFILKNMAWACPTMSVYLFCSDANESFLRAILKDKAAHYHIIPVFEGIGTCESGKKAYNQFLTSADFYCQVNATYLMTVQMDVFFRRKIPPFIFAGDYYGNPWAWDTTLPGGGGVTVRRIAKMIELCNSFGPNETENEDTWIAKHIVKTGGFYPEWEKCGVICMESIRAEHPYILHQFWTFLYQYMRMPKEECITYWNHLLTLCED